MARLALNLGFSRFLDQPTLFVVISTQDQYRFFPNRLEKWYVKSDHRCFPGRIVAKEQTIGGKVKIISQFIQSRHVRQPLDFFTTTL
jgi:hypothetical protein